MISTSNLPCIVEDYQNRDEWLLARMSGVGASDVAAILGEGYKDQSPLTVWDSKKNPPREVPPEKLKRFQIAKRLEPAMRAIFTDETGWPCELPGEYTICRSREFPWLCASLDGLIEHPEYGLCVGELKDVGQHNRHEWENDEPPLKYAIQVQAQMATTGLPFGFCMALCGREPIIKAVPRNERFIDAMIGKLAEFWDYVERGELPPIDASAATGRILAKLWPEDSGATVVLPPAAAEWDAALTKAKEDIKEAEARKLAAENLIKAAIGDASYGDLPDGGRYSWKSQDRRILCKHCGEVLSDSTFRVLRRGK